MMQTTLRRIRAAGPCGTWLEDGELEDASFRTFSEAIKFAKRNWQPDHYDVMKRLPDGTLTTEF